MEQSETDAKVLEVQKTKDYEKARLIEEIQREEEGSKVILSNILCLKNGPDPLLLEQEQIEQENLLEKFVIQQSCLRRNEVIAQMSNILNEEMEKIQSYQMERNATSRSILEQEQESSAILGRLFECNDKNREVILQQIADDDILQKSAVATLIAKNDARSWGLVEQIRILEFELGKLTNLEIERKKLCVSEQINEISTRRVEITYVLMELIAQQDKRKVELVQTLEKMEAAKTSPDFWLLQYQKLLDQQPVELSAAAIDPELGYEFLKTGVVHCLPFLSRLWQDSQIQIENITEEHLLRAGIQSEKDRENILNSIASFVGEGALATVPQPESPTLASECVVCMDAEVCVLFVPCGHLCCCNQCQSSLDECPMCRATVEKRVKIIQS